MSIIQQQGNYFDVSHYIVEWRDDKYEYHYPLHELTGADLKLYLILCHFANRFHKTKFYMDDKRLIGYTGLSLRQLCRSRDKLRSLKLIKTRKRSGLAIDYEIMILGKKWREEMSRKASLCAKDGIPI